MRPGQVVRSTIGIGSHRGVIVVPEAAVIAAEGGRSTLRLAVAGKTEVREVKLGARVRGRVIIASGLQPDDEVITAGHEGLKLGDPVEIVRSEAATGVEPSSEKR